jgi:hypothetical protein
VWLGHGDRPGPVRGHPWVLVGSFRPQGDENDGPVVLASEMAWAGLSVLMNAVGPDLKQSDRRRFWRNSMKYLKRRAISHGAWAAATWMVDQTPAAARFARFAGGWTGHTVTASGAGVAVVATGISPHALRLVTLGSDSDYNFAPMEPITSPDTFINSIERALGSHAWDRRPRRLHADQRRILNFVE